MDIKEQLTDSGAVIGYRPDLRYEKKIESETNIIQQSDINDYVNNNDSYTKTVQSFLNNKPSDVINDLNDNIITINDIIDSLSKAFKENKYNKYSSIESYIQALDNKNEVYVKDFLEFHKTDISKSQIPEIIKTLHLEKERIKIISETLKTLY